MARKRIVWRLFPAFVGIALICLLTATWYTARSWRAYYLEQTAVDLENRARLVGVYLQDASPVPDEQRINQICRELGSLTSTRLTVILPSGKVVGDSEEDPDRMDNHADRPEIREAMQGKVGMATRFSFTIGHNMMYVAVPLRQENLVVQVIRASLPMKIIDQAIKALSWKIALGGLGVALLVAVLSFLIARRISGPLDDLKRGALRFARGELGRPLPIPDTDELASLAEALNHMADELQNKIKSLTRQGQEQEAILSSMSDGVLALDAEGRLMNINSAGAKMLGVSPETAKGQSIHDLVEDPELKWFITRTLSQPEPIEEEVETKLNGKRILKVHGTSLRDAEKKSLGTLIVIHDITQLRQLENTRRDFVANVSHELKTPITSIKGFVETLMAGALKEPENAENFLHIIAKQTDRLDEIIDDLLSLSRIEQDAERGQILLHGQKIQGVLQSAIQVCEAKAKAKRIEVQVACPEELRSLINPALLEQALVNLIDNAIKFSEPGSVVQVEAEQSGFEVIIRVRDQGPGIPAEHLPRIFERFYRVDAGRSRKIGGSGLGLAIVKHISLAHSGRVTVKSTPGKETVFSLHLRTD